ncbi:MAG: peptidylprolyl isomerase [Spirochaetales bacterium]|nr:peptidylprolyl isomerase [Spirochaetales bacterium]
MSGCSNSYQDLADGLYAEINTTRGPILVELEYERTPLTVCNFVSLAEGTMETDAREGKYYDGLNFHRVISDFMIQGGCPLGTGTGGPGYRFADEIDPALTFDGPGKLAMANAGAGTNGSQFFITHVATPHLNGAHTIFGHVVEGQKVVDTVQQGDEIKSVTIIRKGAEAEAFETGQEAFDKLNREIEEKLAAEKEEKAKEILAEIQSQFPDVKKDEYGVYYDITREGTGSEPAKGTLVKAHYKGTFLDGRKFDSSYDRGEPFEFQVGIGQVIPAWDLTLLQMKKGEKRTIVSPPELAYGSRGAGGVIPPDAWLVFEIELVDFQ